MKNYFRLLFVLILSLCSTISLSQTKLNSLEKSFYRVPDSIQTSCYWYWMSGNISIDGVQKDLESMKKVGINRAYIGNIGYPATPYGKVEIFSDEWWDIIHTALKTATKLNIEIGIFNSPGWSQSGGPWIKPEQTMRYLAASDTAIQGGRLLDITLKKPIKPFQDVRVLAFPISQNYGSSISDLNPKLSCIPANKDIENIMNSANANDISLPPSGTFQLDINAPTPYTATSITIYPANVRMKAIAELQIKMDGKFKTIKTFEIDRSNDELIVGFKPYGPVSISLPQVTSSNYRIIFSNATPGSAIRRIDISSAPVVEHYIEKTLAKMCQTPYPLWGQYLWPDQPIVENRNLLLDPSKVVDISSFMDTTGHLSWTAPTGRWLLLRTGMTPTGVKNDPAPPKGVGPEVDKMNKDYISWHFDNFLGKIMKKVPAQDRKTWKICVEDSYERGGQNWTDGFISKYKNAFGYDPAAYIPVIFGKPVASEDISDRFLWDLRRFVADRVAFDYVGGLTQVSHQHGLTTWLENYGHWGFPGEFLQYGGQSDEVSGEFWSEGQLGNIENRAASSCAHIYGKNKTYAESFTCGGAAYSRYPASMKARGDRFFTEGVNSSLLHVYIDQPYEDKYPGVNADFGNEFNRHNTWFNDLDLFITYLKRCNFMLQQGRYVADVAYFIGEDAPKMTGICDPKLPQGYSYDYINADVIKNRLNVKNGAWILPNGLSYRILVLPRITTIRPELLEKIRELVKKGGIILGPKPERSPSLQGYPSCDSVVKRLASELWGNLDSKNSFSHPYGKGLVMDGMDLKKALSYLNQLPDCKMNPNDSTLFIHRKTQTADIYFVSNQQNKTIEIFPEFHISGKQPELFDPVSGNARILKSFVQHGSTTTVPLLLVANESAFIVFKKNTHKKHGFSDIKKNYPLPQEILAINNPWKVKFNDPFGGDSHTALFTELKDWTTNSNDSIRHFSGTATYSNSFFMTANPKGRNVFLDLGEVKDIAKIKINGIYAGGVWTAPYRLDITPYIRKGHNRIEINVVNTWNNRLIGDLNKIPAQRKTWTSVNPYKADSPLSISGLLGPVRLYNIYY